MLVFIIDPNVVFFFGSIGASIVVESQTVPPIFHQLISNSLCFLLYEDNQFVPDEWNEVRAQNILLYCCCIFCVGVHVFH